MKAFKCDVTRSVTFVLFPVADMRDTFCDVADDGWLNVDSLDVY